MEVVQPHTKNILHINAPLAGFRFEYHQKEQIVYLVRKSVSGPEIGDPIYVGCETHGAAIMGVLLWCRGYKEAKLELQLEKILK